MIILENESVQATFSPKGAELQSLKNKTFNINYLWRGDAAYWGKFSPILFPIVGGLKDNTYYYKDQAYTLPRHGFARDREFAVEKISDTEVLFTLETDDETLKVYPFQFRLGLRYTLSGTTLSCTYEVTNTSGTESLLFSVGGHPAFALPLENGVNYNDYQLHFNKDQELTYNKLNKDLIDDETGSIALQDGNLPLKHELFYEDALVFKNLHSDHIRLSSNKSAHGLDFHFTDFPFFGIWAARDADFVCLEPWCGIADGIHHNQMLESKEGIQSLAANENWNRSWKVSIF